MSDLEKASAFLFYNDERGKISVQVIVGDDTVWTTQNGMADIFETSKQNISYHLANIFKDSELNSNSVVKEILTTANDGKSYKTQFYSLDAIISVGYRVSSFKATRFRQWATRVLNSYLIKGFALDDERLKQGNNLFNKDYLKELLERIRDIRASEKLFYEKVREFYKTSVDYDKNDPETHKFYARVQNKLEYAIIGKTSAEIIAERADASKINMGLTTWKSAGRDGDILKSDVTIAKNYLLEDEIKELNLLVNMFLDYIEIQIKRSSSFIKMKDWEEKLDLFLNFNGFKVLTNAGTIRKDFADKKAEDELIKFKIIKENNERLEADKQWKEFVELMKGGTSLPIEKTISKDENVITETEFSNELTKLLKVPPPKKNK